MWGQVARCGIRWIAGIACGLSLQVTALAQAVTGLSAPEGFEVTHFADDDLAHDIYSLTIDAAGRVVVSGRGYVKTLIDADGDGKAESARPFATSPANGAQGMYFLEKDLLCIGDAGLLRYRDADGDGTADGPPDVFLKLSTGNEHHVHSIQKGPDGWWYVIAGNDAGIDRRYATLKSSPIKQPENGVLFRLKPDLSGAELLTHGLRNAYDFAFNSRGDVFTFDSDDERDISLPWYRPNRVMHLLTGGHAGWLTRNWKQPDYFPDMLPVLADFGRGSPTGVICYRHTQFPERYRDSLFVLDWTYGRILNVKLDPSLASYHGTPETFVTATGGFGFAPTDLDVGPDGSLYVSVGGRGTRGSVYRIRALQAATTQWPGKLTTNESKVTACVRAPQPLSSWSRHVWEPLAREVGRAAFEKLMHDEARPTQDRVRAIEILTDLFGGVSPSDVTRLRDDESSEVRARAIWSLGRTQPVGEHLEIFATYLADRDAAVGRVTSEALLSLNGPLNSDAALKGLVTRFKSESPYDRMLAAQLIPLLDEAAFRKLSVTVANSGMQAGLANGFGYLGRKPGINLYAFKLGTLVLAKSPSVDLRLQAVRLMQLGLGDLVPQAKHAPAFDGYGARFDLEAVERDLDPFRIELAERFPTGNDRLDLELARLLAMLQPYNPELLNQVLAKITEKSHPTDDLHYLMVAARIAANREARHTLAVAKGLVGIAPKLKERQMAVDSSWDDRFGEIYKAHVDLDPDLPVVMVKQPNFGHPGHVLFMSQVPGQFVTEAIAAFAKQIAADKDYVWTNDVLFLIGESEVPEHRALMRSQIDNFGVRAALLQVLSNQPQAADRALFIEGLDASQLEAVTASLTALETLPRESNPIEQVALLRLLRRLGADKAEYALRERVARLMERNTGEKPLFEYGELGYRPQAQAIEQWTKIISQRHPQEYAAAMGSSTDELRTLKDMLSNVDWGKGDGARGRKLFETRSCVQCHGSSKALGPDLAGVAGRFSREDLFIAIVLPNRDVSPRYQTTLIETKAGKVLTGLVVYESVDGVLLRNSTNQTFRIETADIEQRRRMPQSLMPSGLLKGLTPQDLADLYAFLKQMTPPM